MNNMIMTAASANTVGFANILNKAVEIDGGHANTVLDFHHQLLELLVYFCYLMLFCHKKEHDKPF